MNSVSLPLERRNEILNHPRLRAAVHKVICSQIRDEEHRREVSQKTFLFAQEDDGLTDDLEQCIRRVRGTAYRKAKEHKREIHRWKRKRVRLLNDVPEDDEADLRDAIFIAKVGHAPIEEREIVAKVSAQIPASKWETFQWFARTTLAGYTYVDIAEETGLPEDTVRKRVETLRKQLLKIVLSLTVAILVFFVGRALLRPRNDVAKPGPAPAPSAAPSASAAPVGPAEPAPPEGTSGDKPGPGLKTRSKGP